MTITFRYEPKPARVLFGEGSIAELPKAVQELGCHRALVVSTAGQRRLAELASETLGPAATGIFSGAVMHTPVAVSEAALARLRELKADAIVAIGGGSTIGLSKALALRTDLPQVVLPTTYAGSEMTDILGETRDGAKTSQRTAKVLPETVIYDAALSFDLPPRISAVSGMNAVAHAVEALYAEDTNPVIALMAEEGIRLMSGSLPEIMNDPRNPAWRNLALRGAWLCALCVGNAAMGLHHKICHVLGGSFALPHAETHTVMLPHTAAYNHGAAPEAMAVVARALRTADAVTGLDRLKRLLVGGLSLVELGMQASDIDRAAEAACANPYANPRPVEYDAVRAMIRAAFAGEAPAS